MKKILISLIFVGLFFGAAILTSCTKTETCSDGSTSSDCSTTDNGSQDNGNKNPSVVTATVTQNGSKVNSVSTSTLPNHAVQIVIAFVTNNGGTASNLRLDSSVVLKDGWGNMYLNGCDSFSGGGTCQATLTFAPTRIVNGTLNLTFDYLDNQNNSQTVTASVKYSSYNSPGIHIALSPDIKNITAQLKTPPGQALSITFTSDTTGQNVNNFKMDISDLLSHGWTVNPSLSDKIFRCTTVSTDASCVLNLNYAPQFSTDTGNLNSIHYNFDGAPYDMILINDNNKYPNGIPYTISSTPPPPTKHECLATDSDLANHLNDDTCYYPSINDYCAALNTYSTSKSAPKNDFSGCWVLKGIQDAANPQDIDSNTCGSDGLSTCGIWIFDLIHKHTMGCGIINNPSEFTQAIGSNFGSIDFQNTIGQSSSSSYDFVNQYLYQTIDSSINDIQDYFIPNTQLKFVRSVSNDSNVNSIISNSLCSSSFPSFTNDYKP